MLTSKPSKTVRGICGACKTIGSEIRLKISKGMLFLITPRSFTDLLMPFMNPSLALLPTLDEVNLAIASLSSGKAPGSDGIPPEIFAAGGPTLVTKLLELYSAMWKQDRGTP